MAMNIGVRKSALPSKMLMPWADEYTWWFMSTCLMCS